MRNKNSNIQGRSLNVIKVISILYGTAHKGKNLLPLGAKFFPLREVQNFEKGHNCRESLLDPVVSL